MDLNFLGDEAVLMSPGSYFYVVRTNAILTGQLNALILESIDPVVLDDLRLGDHFLLIIYKIIIYIYKMCLCYLNLERVLIIF